MYFRGQFRAAPGVLLAVRSSVSHIVGRLSAGIVEKRARRAVSAAHGADAVELRCPCGKVVGRGRGVHLFTLLPHETMGVP